MRWRDWLGVGERRWRKAPDEEVQPAKTLWDWLQLLIVPAILIGVTFVWSATQTRSDNKREDRRIAADRAAAEEARRDTTLQTFLDRMSDLIIHEGLLSTKRPPAVAAVAHTLTAAAVRRLDGARKGQVVLFLGDAGLLDAGSDMLLDADLTGADLTNVNFVSTEGLVAAKNVDLGRFLAETSPNRRRLFFLWQGPDLASLSREELAKFNLSPEKLARFRREAGGG